MKAKKGFTLIELSLSMVFIAVLSILIVLVINSAITSFRRGITLNLLNTVGSEVVDDIRVSVQNSPSKKPECESIYGEEECNDDDEDSEFVPVVKKVGENGIPIYGAFCTGKYSFVWRSGYAINSNFYGIDETISVKIGENVKSDFRLLKVIDTDLTVCRRMASVYNGSELSTIIDITDGSVREDSLEEVLDENTSGGIVAYDLDVESMISGGGGLFYLIELKLGTLQSGVDIGGSGQCIVPERENSDSDYCAINKFNFAALANGGN